MGNASHYNHHLHRRDGRSGSPVSMRSTSSLGFRSHSHGVEDGELLAEDLVARSKSGLGFVRRTGSTSSASWNMSKSPTRVRIGHSTLVGIPHLPLISGPSGPNTLLSKGPSFALLMGVGDPTMGDTKSKVRSQSWPNLKGKGMHFLKSTLLTGIPTGTSILTFSTIQRQCGLREQLPEEPCLGRPTTAAGSQGF